jgi:hypothetical protein
LPVDFVDNQQVRGIHVQVFCAFKRGEFSASDVGAEEVFGNAGCPRNAEDGPSPDRAHPHAQLASPSANGWLAATERRGYDDRWLNAEPVKQEAILLGRPRCPALVRHLDARCSPGGAEARKVT